MTIASPAVVPEKRRALIALAMLVAFFAAAYGTALKLPFIGDDYVFLDRTRNASFLEIWSPRNIDFSWYRPWSRELHFWTLQRLFGLNEWAFRLAGAALWFAALVLFWNVVQRVSSARVAYVGTIGVATLALWGTPLLWISGSQDLWMVLFSLISLLLFVRGRRMAAVVPYLGALLSKETSAVLPAILLGYCLLIERERPSVALRRIAPFLLISIAWMVVHPTLLHRLFDPQSNSPEIVEHRLSIPAIAIKTLLSALNLDVVPRPVEVGSIGLLRMLLACGAIAVAAFFATRPDELSRGEPDRESRAIKFGAWWATVSWLPLILPSIGWHAYYGCLGAMGAWIVIATFLARSRIAAIVVLTALALLQGLHANTPSRDWGNEWYQRRAGSLLSAIRRDLLAQHPTLPRHSRIYFGHVPNNIGLVSGQSAAVRVWYDDPTLEAGFYSYFRPRVAGSPSGADYFFRFDSLAGLVEVNVGPEQVRSAMQRNPSWEADHEALAVLFLQNGATRQAAEEFEKLAALPNRPDALVFAAVCYRGLGNESAANELLARAATGMKRSRADIEAWASVLLASMPARTQPANHAR